ncbi:MAG: polymer-forming cytoskeletal protein [Firmicutes bacterium]|nr:polymer-forming cytoskeletal protein [Bacillota bacterium]
MVFGKKKSKEVSLLPPSSTAEVVTGKLDTVIGQGAVINGTVKTEGTLRVDGKIEGEVHVTGDLIIGESGLIAANITAQNVSVAGLVKGNIRADGKLNLLASGKVYGDIHVNDLAVSQGAILQGEVRMTTAGGELED